MYHYRIFQVKNGELFRDVRFWDIFSHNQSEKFDFSAYDLVYQGDMESSSREHALEELFRMFNIEHPEDFQGRSLSVSDVIELTENNGEYQYFYCKSMGWEDVTERCLGSFFLIGGFYDKRREG